MRSERANYYADLIINEGRTIREVANIVRVSKSTVHLYISKYTTGISRKLKLRHQLDLNHRQGVLKGGHTTKLKYLALAKLKRDNSQEVLP